MSSTEVSDSAGAPVPCPDPEPIQPAGFVRCGNGLTHRPEAVACGDPTPVGEPCIYPEPGDCTTDGDCADAAAGACLQGFVGCSCLYGCGGDDDCAADEICLCAGELADFAPRCVPTQGCAVDADCGDDGLCAASLHDGSEHSVEDFAVLACHVPSDVCFGDADCDPAEACKLTDGAWACTPL